MGKYKILVRKIAKTGWMVSVLYLYESAKEWDIVYVGLEYSQPPALSRGHEEAEKHYDALLEHAYDDDYRRY